MDLAIEIKNLTKEYPGIKALKDVSFSVKKGSIHGFLGPNGAGKSTTMKIIAGIITESGGSFSLNGRVGFLPENPPLYPHMSVVEYLEFVFEIHSLKKIEKEKLTSIIKKTGLTNVGDRLIGNLSKGYQQRVGIAQAIIHGAEIIILDEPTVGLDPVAIQEIRELIKELKTEHTILFSSHQLHDVELLCSDITLINEGSIVVSGEMKEILKNLKKECVLKARVLQFDESIEKDFLEKFKSEIYILNKSVDSNEVVLECRMSQDNHIRKAFTQFLSQGHIGLLEVVEQKAELEDLFKRISSKN